MSRITRTIVFTSLHDLWAFVQKINASNIEVITAERKLICDCSEEDALLLPIYKGRLLQPIKSMPHSN